MEGTMPNASPASTVMHCFPILKNLHMAFPSRHYDKINLVILE